MASSAFRGGLFSTLQNHVGPLQGVWGHWGALIRLHGVSSCCQLQRPSRPTMSTVAVSVPYWGNTAAVCLLVILQLLEKNYLKTQQCQLGGRISYKTIAT